MIFGDIPADEALGTILAHSVTVGSQRFRKGRVLMADDIEALKAAGHASVIAARIEAGDLPEDDAATLLAEAAAGDGVEVTAAFTGRANLYAAAHGLAMIDAARLDALNLIHEAITIATVDPLSRVSARRMLATVKIIPFAAPREQTLRVLDILNRGSRLVSLAEFTSRPVGLVTTTLPGLKEAMADKTRKVIDARVEALGSQVAREVRVPHDAEAVAKAVADLLTGGCDPVLIMGASATVDRRDVVPAGIAQAGGEIVHFGMPVDPGNLMLMARHADRTVIGLPGCARSPRLNGFDWVLQRTLAGIQVSREDIMRMGAGGLLKEIPSRPTPRDRPVEAPHAPRVHAVLLAAGQSRRMGNVNKLLADVDGDPMIVRVAGALKASQATGITVVTGHEADRVQKTLTSLGATFIHNSAYAEGLSTSLKTGVEAVPENADAVLFAQGDMPGLSATHVNRLIAAFNPVEGRAIIVPTHGGKRGNPVLWSRGFLPEMAAIEGDVGARHLIGAYADMVAEVEMDDDAVLTDLDTPDALASWIDRRTD